MVYLEISQISQLINESLPNKNGAYDPKFP